MGSLGKNPITLGMPTPPPPRGGRMVRGPNGNMYSPNELPSNLRMQTGLDPRVDALRGASGAPNRAVFADDYVLKPSDQGYMSNDLPRPMSTNQQQVPQGIASLSNMRYGDSQRQQAFGNEQQRLLNQMNRFDGRFRGR
jgi:hypothetical protein